VTVRKRINQQYRTQAIIALTAASTARATGKRARSAIREFNTFLEKFGDGGEND
jgi:hypothetical protein